MLHKPSFRNAKIIFPFSDEDTILPYETTLMDKDDIAPGNRNMLSTSFIEVNWVLDEIGRGLPLVYLLEK